MVQIKALETSAQVTIAAVAGALASIFLSNWVNQYGFGKSFPLILGYTLFIMLVLYFFFRKS